MLTHYPPRASSVGAGWLLLLACLAGAAAPCCGQGPQQAPTVHFDQSHAAGDFVLAEHGRATAIYLPPQTPQSVRVAAEVFSSDVERVTGAKPEIVSSLGGRTFPSLVILAVLGHAEEIGSLEKNAKLETSQIEGKWESAVTAVVERPLPHVGRALVIAGSDRRGAAFALFTLSRAIGVSPWIWWADVPVRHHASLALAAGSYVQHEPSVRYRGIFLNDEDWGLRPWAAKKMDPSLHNIGPHTYERVFELLLRLHANTLWPAMHPGTLAFNALPENAELADRWGIVMGSSHSEALLRNNVGEWDEKRDGPWNYQQNRAAIDAYWEKRVSANGRYENVYTVGMRGVHDTGLEATGTAEVKARLVEEAMHTQRSLLGKYVNGDVAKVPQVIWLYKESLALYRAGMRVPEDVTLGWTDDNYGYLRQLPTVAEQKREGGSGVYYHVSYWGFPHDYLWLCSTPPALIREEMSKAFDHDARRFWILNVGDLKPAEADIDYFLQLAWDEPSVAAIDQHTFLETWAAEQFPAAASATVADAMSRYYELNFVRKPEFMGFNGYDDGIERTAFNPLAWGDQNRTRLEAWRRLRQQEEAIARTMPAEYKAAFFELVTYPIEAAAAQNEKLLWTDRSFLDAALHDEAARQNDAAEARAAYDRILALTAEYNSMLGGKWEGMMSATPRDRQVFKMPPAASARDASDALPAAWKADQAAAAIPPRGETGFVEQHATVSINAAHFERKSDGAQARWRVLPELGISGASVVYGEPGLLAEHPSQSAPPGGAPWLEYDFETSSLAPAVLTVHTLPTFAVDAEHRLRYLVALDGGEPISIDASVSGEWSEDSAPVWAANVLRNSAVSTTSLGVLRAGHHTLRLIYQGQGVVFEHLVITFPSSPPAYPVPPETGTAEHSLHQ